jgi:hypothetical protein
VQVVMLKGELAMVWTIMQGRQRMHQLIQHKKQMRLIHISHHPLIQMLQVNQVCNFLLVKRLRQPIWTFHSIHLPLSISQKSHLARHKHLQRFLNLDSINKCITVLEGLHGLQIGDILVAADIFKGKDNREVFLSFSSDALRLAWIRKEIAALE